MREYHEWAMMGPELTIPGPKMKGAMLAEYLRWYATRYDVERLTGMIRDNPVCKASGLNVDPPAFGIVSSIWYPAEAFHAVLDGATWGMSEEEKQRLTIEGTEHVTEKMFRGMYAVLFRLLATPERYATHIQRAWSQLHSTGEREFRLVSGAKTAKTGEAISTIRAWPAHHPLLCAMVHETTRAVFARMELGAVTVRREQCISKGHTECVARVRWG